MSSLAAQKTCPCLGFCYSACSAPAFQWREESKELGVCLGCFAFPARAHPSRYGTDRHRRCCSSAKQDLGEARGNILLLQVLVQLFSCWDFAFSDALGGWQQPSRIPLPDGVSYRARAGAAVTFP